jgi:transcriptional regulator with XRE-family HTH domain
MKGGTPNNTSNQTEAERARERAGLTRQQLAKKARISDAYLRNIEHRGRASFALAERLSVLCRCRIETYL